MTDADVDGSHIATLLITFFYKYMKSLIDENKLYLAMPPLFKIYNKSKSFYASMKESFLCIFVYIFKCYGANLDSINVQLLLQLKLKTSVIKRDSLALHLESQDF